MSDYDSPWEEMLEGYFPDFMAFFLPEAAVAGPFEHVEELLADLRS
jgi:hypothetical protein